MHRLYLVVLFACAAAVVALVGARLFALRRRPQPTRGRLFNEWAWTVVPLLVLAAMVCHALKVAK